MTVKYQQRIHEAFAKSLCVDAEEKYKEFCEKYKMYPQLLESADVSSFMPEDAAAIATSNAYICEHFAVKSEDADAIEFSKGIHLKTVKQTVKTNLAYYKNLLQFINDEKEDDYSKIYKAIKTKLDAYFERAAEDILNDVYGERYAKFFEEKYAEFAENAKKNSSKKKSAE